MKNDIYQSLEGTVAVITGAAGGIGAATAERFASLGARLVLIDREPIAPANENDICLTCDLADSAAVAAIGPRILEAAGRLDILVNNAGIGLLAPAETLDVEAWDATMAVNLRAPWLLARSCFEGLCASGRGRIITIASQAAIIGIPEHVAYCASKAGLLGMTRTLAVEWARCGITANCISPTVVETPLALVGWAGEKGERARAEIPTGRFAAPREIAAAAAYLASPEAAMINGENLVIDGGNTIR